MSKKLLLSFLTLFFVAIQLKAQTNLNFSSTPFNGAWSDGIAQDGDGGSTDIPNFDLQFYAANTSFNPLGSICPIQWYNDGDFYASGNPNWTAIMPSYNYITNNSGVQAFVIKSTDPTKKFSLQSIDLFDWSPTFTLVTYVFNTYSGGNFVGSINVAMNPANPPVTLNQAGVLSSSVFNNIDEIRIVPQGAGNKFYPSINNISVTPVTISSNANLSNFSINAGTLNPTFNANTTSYSVSLANATTSIAVTPTKADANATITVNGAPVTSGSSSNNINLNVGANVISTTVTAQDGSTKTYTLTATRAASANADLSGLSLSSGTLSTTFNSSITSYTVSLANATTSIAVTPTKADANASIKVNGTTVTSGFASNYINLNVGINVITTTVTAQDGTTKTYTITATRAASANADLSGLSLSAGILSSTFNSSTTTYTVSLANATTSIAITPTTSDANATITVNGAAVNSGSSSNTINLNIGDNNITTVVTAQDGNTTKTYTITATRAKADQTITFPTIANKLVNDADFEPLATTNSGLALSYNSDNTNVATVYQDALDGNKWKIKIQGAGNCTITASQAGDNNYNSATASKSFTVTSVLPVSLTAFNIKKQNNGEVLLNWITASEQNNEKFIVSRSSDGIHFKVLADIIAAANGQQLNSYHYQDLLPENGINYYKLAQQDKDGKYVELGIKIIEVQLDGVSKVKIYPNPTTDLVTVSFTPGIFTKMSLFNLEGKLILKQDIAKESNSLDFKTNNLPQGSYVVKMIGLGASSAHQIIKN